MLVLLSYKATMGLGFGWVAAGKARSLGMPELKGITKISYFIGEETKWLAQGGTLGWWQNLV